MTQSALQNFTFSRKNELCLVRRNEKHFERAVLVEVDDEKARVVSVDYGGFYYVTKDSLFKIDKSLCMPLYTHMCRVDGKFFILLTNLSS